MKLSYVSTFAAVVAYAALAIGASTFLSGCASPSFVPPKPVAGYSKRDLRVYVSPKLPLDVQADAVNAVDEWARVLASVADVDLTDVPEMASVEIHPGRDGAQSASGEYLVGSTTANGRYVFLHVGTARTFGLPLRRVALHELGHALAGLEDDTLASLMLVHGYRSQRHYVDCFTRSAVAEHFHVPTSAIGYTESWRDSGCPK